MSIDRHPSATTFLEAARAELERAEAFNGLLLGIATRLQRLDREGGPHVHGENADPVLLTARDEAGLHLVALHTPPRKVIVHGASGWRAEVPGLVEYLAGLDADLPGVIGPKPVALAVAEEWQRQRGGRCEARMAMGVYELRQVEDAGSAPGFLRQATGEDVELLTEWVVDFNEVVHEPMSGGKAGVREEVDRMIDAGQVYLWQNGGRPVSLVRWGRPTAHGICVTTVYTPPPLRGRGYATRCVAALSQQLLDEGRSFCTLFTDLSNPTSNHIYQQIGYRWLGEFAEYDFVAAGTTPT